MHFAYDIGRQAAIVAVNPKKSVLLVSRLIATHELGAEL